jgi:preprotein translocase subunit SecE
VVQSRELPAPEITQREKRIMAGALEAIKEWPVATKNYITELQNEMRKVTWPNAKQVRATTGVVIVTVFAFAGFFAIVDAILSRTIIRVYDILAK